jgi:hypothetical protein
MWANERSSACCSATYGLSARALRTLLGKPQRSLGCELDELWNSAGDELVGWLLHVWASWGC